MVSYRRYGRYRGVILALGGLILIGASPPSKQDGTNPPQASNEKIERSLEDIATSLKQANKPSEHDKPCSKGDDYRDSDLCAQWKAADAAKSAADAAWWIGGFGLLIGAFTLGAAVAAAIYARSAAIHTKTSADSFIEAERAILHAADGSVGLSNVDGREIVCIDFVNRGRSNGRIIEIGSESNIETENFSISERWTTVPPGGEKAHVPAFDPPKRHEILSVNCWVKYRTTGPDIHTSYFTVKVYWVSGDRYSPVMTIPHWAVETTNPNGHPNDT
ncbi:MAG: hypothetical protein AB7U35_07625 [Sphingobium sp.]